MHASWNLLLSPLSQCPMASASSLCQFNHAQQSTCSMLKRGELLKESETNNESTTRNEDGKSHYIPPCTIPMQTFYRCPSTNSHWDNSIYILAILECSLYRYPSGCPKHFPQGFTCISISFFMIKLNTHVFVGAG